MKLKIVAAMLGLALAVSGVIARTAPKPAPTTPHRADVYKLSNFRGGCARIYAEGAQVDVPGGESRDVKVFAGKSYLVSMFRSTKTCGGSAVKSQWLNANGNGYWELH